jgi:hypothetical protein
MRVHSPRERGRSVQLEEGHDFPRKERVRTAKGGHNFQEEKRAQFSRNCSIKC